jgi:hypothetical protein
LIEPPKHSLPIRDARYAIFDIKRDNGGILVDKI